MVGSQIISSWKMMEPPMIDPVAGNEKKYISDLTKKRPFWLNLNSEWGGRVGNLLQEFLVTCIWNSFYLCDPQILKLNTEFEVGLMWQGS